MDHTFGHRDIIDSLSQGSGGKKSPGSSGSHKSSRKSSSSSARSGKLLTGSQGVGGGSVASNSCVDEAYKRQGKRLSILAHGDVPPPRPPPAIIIEADESSSFDYYRGPPPDIPPPRRSSTIVRKLIFEARNSFRKWEDAERNTKGHASSNNRSSSSRSKQQKDDKKYGAAVRGASSSSSSSQILEDWETSPQGDLTSSSWRGTRGRPGEMRTNKGLLSAVLEGHSDSNTSVSNPAHADRSNHTSPSESISTKDTRSAGGGTAGGYATNTGNSAGGGYNSGSTSANGGNGSDSGAPVAPGPHDVARGKCLTLPTEAVGNAGLDNGDGNLIVFENDTLTVPRKSLHTFGPKDKSRKRSNTFRVQKLLGQGTFAQVFQCLHEETGELVAVKVVKNKPAYTRQATVEIDVFRALQDNTKNQIPENAASEEGVPESASDYMVNMNCYFMYHSHLCMVFNLLGLNLYEVLKRRQFRGLPLSVVQSIVKQALQGVKELSHRSIVHCDLKPENILLVSDDVVDEVVTAGDSIIQSKGAKPESDGASTGKNTGMSVGHSTISSGTDPSEESRADTIHASNQHDPAGKLEKGTKLIDFGSACFEGYTVHTYIQSRFYRSPEVILGIPYDSAIDMWSLGCVAAELLLGLPILPGVHEHDQLCRIEEMVNKIPDWMLDQGTKASKYYVKFVARPATASSSAGDGSSSSGGPAPTPTPPLPQWRLKSLQEFIRSLSQSDIEKKGGLAKLEKPPGNRYFRKKSLSEILRLHSSTFPGEEKTLLIAFVHFLYGVLDPDPWKRWTAFQAVQHPFITGEVSQLKKKPQDLKLDSKETNQANILTEYYWKAPWDPAICRRKLLNVQKMREKQQAMRRTLHSRSPSSELSRRTRRTEPSSNTSSKRETPSTASSPFGNMSSMMRESQRIDSAGRIVDTTPPFVAPSSLTDLGRVGERSQFADGGSAVMSRGEDSSRKASLSFQSGLYEPGQQFVEADFAYALQRPGVVPGRSSAQGSYSSRNDLSVNLSIPGMSDMSLGGASAPRTLSHAQSQGQFGGSTGYGSGQNEHQFMYASHDSDLGAHRRGGHFGNASVASSAASSVTTDTHSMYGGFQGMHLHNSQQQPYTDPQQLAMLQQQQQIAAMQQMQGQGSSQQSQFGMQQMGMQQAPVVTQVQAPGGGYYFVTTSATGQTMLLQPVAFLNQSQQMPMYGGQPQGAPQNQPSQGQMAQGQFMSQQVMGQQAMSQPGMQQQGTVQQGISQDGISQPGSTQSGIQQPGLPQQGMQQGLPMQGMAQQGIAQQGIQQFPQMQMQQGQMQIPQNQMFQGGMQFGSGINPQAQFQHQQFYQPQTQQQQQQQNIYPGMMQQQQQQQHGAMDDQSHQSYDHSHQSSHARRHQGPPNPGGQGW